VGAQFGGAGGRGTGIEHIGERDTGESHHADDCVRVGHGPAATDRELDVPPFDTRVSERELDGVGAHLHCGFALEATERVQTHSDDSDVIHAIAPDSLSSAMRSQSMPSSIRTISVCSDACGALVVTSGSWLN